GEAHPPECRGDDDALGALGIPPLHDEARREQALAEQADEHPELEVVGPALDVQRDAFHAQISSVCVRRWRRISQLTPRRSARPTHRRFHMPYFDTPRVRGRWLTGTLWTRKPARCTSAGRKRCMWSNAGSSRNSSRSISLMPQPVSGVASRSNRER